MGVCRYVCAIIRVIIDALLGARGPWYFQMWEAKNNNFFLSAPAFLHQRIGPVGSRDTTQRERALSVMPGLLLPVVGISLYVLHAGTERPQPVDVPDLRTKHLGSSEPGHD